MFKEEIMSLASGRLCVSFDTSIYSVLALKKSAYKFTDRAAILITEAENGKVAVCFDFPTEKELEAQKKIIGDFCNEVLDQDLREIIAAETEATRNLILAQAFSKTSLLGNS